MLALQSAIGSANDLRDVTRDALAGRAKPIPTGQVGPRLAFAIAVAGVAIGLALSVLLGPWLLLTAALGLAAGLAYDLALKGTPLSWLPFVVGVPLLVLFAWFGARTCLPPELFVLVGLAALAGASLALTNALADLEHDTAAGVGSVATWLGPQIAWRLAALTSVAGLAAVVVSLATAAGGASPPPAEPLLVAGVIAGSLAVVSGLVLASGGVAARRQLGWELEAVGFSIVALGWLGSMLARGGMGC